MAQAVIQCEGVSKKFCRSLTATALHGARDTLRRLLGRSPSNQLGKGEFWALRDISLSAGPGECIGVIGPNGAGKSTLLKLISREHRPEQGRIRVQGRVTCVGRLGADLQPLLTGRENIQARCVQLAPRRTDSDRLFAEIVAFAGLEKFLDIPLRNYSDGMHARLDFALATAVTPDILLIDEVLAVGDIAFQMRCLERLDQLKHLGTTILLVSHSEMNIRQVADRCLLLFDGEALAIGSTDTLFLKYYETLGFANRVLSPLGATPPRPRDGTGPLTLDAVLAVDFHPSDTVCVELGASLELELRVSARVAEPAPRLILEFWTTSGLLLASFDSECNGGLPALLAGPASLRLRIPFLGLPAGIYRVAGGFPDAGGWLSYGSDFLRVTVRESQTAMHGGFLALAGEVRPASPRQRA